MTIPDFCSVLYNKKTMYFCSMCLFQITYFMFQFCSMRLFQTTYFCSSYVLWVCCTLLSQILTDAVQLKVSKGANIRNRYNQVPHLTLEYAAPIWSPYCKTQIQQVEKVHIFRFYLFQLLFCANRLFQATYFCSSYVLSFSLSTITLSIRI